MTEILVAFINKISIIYAFTNNKIKTIEDNFCNNLFANKMYANHTLDDI